MSKVVFTYFIFKRGELGTSPYPPKKLTTVVRQHCFVTLMIPLLYGKSESSKDTFCGHAERKTPSGEFRDIAHPINSEARELIQNAILEEYEKAE